MINRRYSELDWLRVILVLAVFLHHVFMPFNGDNWHIVNADSSKTLDDVMVYFEQLRLQTLFFVAGAASALLLPRYGNTKFLTNKFHRLFLPLLVGMMFIVPPQSYYENIEQYESLLAAYGSLIFSFQNNHLWFIEFLVVFMVLAVPLFHLLTSKLGKRLLAKLEALAEYRHGLFSMVLALLVLRGSLKWLWPSQSHAIENWSVSLFFLFWFVLGMVFIQSDSIWKEIKQNRRTNLVWLLICSMVFYGYYYSPDLSPYLSQAVRWQLWWLVCSLVSWAGLLTMLGYAQAYLNQTPDWLRQTNELIYPFYILHQTVIVVLAFYIVQWSGGIALKSATLLIASLLICVSICLLAIRPFNSMRYLFGLKRLHKDGQPKSASVN